MNKIDPRVDSDRDNRAQHQAMGGAAGPHSSNVANKVDPRIDSDRDNRAQHQGIGGAGVPHSSNVASHQGIGGAGVPQSSNVASHQGIGGAAGPHSSNIANKADPRVDSDRDNRARHEAMGGAAGPHSSNMSNKVDPRVDSDRDNRAAQFDSPGNYQTGTAGGLGTAGAHGGGINTHNPNVASRVEPVRHQGGVSGAYEPTGVSSTTNNAGPHGSNLANKLDPRVDSDVDNRARHQAIPGSSHGNPQSGATAGPHGSNLVNKLDPRVDSDLDNRGVQRSL